MISFQQHTQFTSTMGIILTYLRFSRFVVDDKYPTTCTIFKYKWNNFYNIYDLSMILRVYFISFSQSFTCVQFHVYKSRDTLLFLIVFVFISQQWVAATALANSQTSIKCLHVATQCCAAVKVTTKGMSCIKVKFTIAIRQAALIRLTQKWVESTKFSIQRSPCCP